MNIIFVIYITLLLGLIFSIGLSTGYLVREFNLLDEQFLNYNVPAFSAIQTSVFIPKNETKLIHITLIKWTPNRTATEKLLKVNILGSLMPSNINGFYLFGDEVYIRDTEGTTLGHEICHYILTQNGVNSITAQEDICYTIQENYKLVREVIQ